MPTIRARSALSRAEKINPVIPDRWKVGRRLIGFWLILLAGAIVAAFFDSRALFLVFGWATCLIVTVPTLDSRYDLLSPWSLVMLTIYVGCGLRPWFIAREIEGARDLDTLFLLGRGPDFFTPSSILFVGGIALLTTGYVASGRPASLVHPATRKKFSSLAEPTVAILALVGLVAFFLFVQRTGGISFATLSAKRTSITSLDLANYQSQGVLRSLSELSSYAYWIATGIWASRRQYSAKYRVARMVLFLNAVALPIYASSRSSAAYILIIGTIITLAVDRSRVERLGRIVLQGAILVTLLITSLTMLRTATGATDSTLTITNVVGQTFVYNRNFTDIPTSAQIIEAIPDRLPSANGSTYLAWLAAPIPRQAWPEKPLISSGPLIGTKVFGQASSGVPPGLVAEAYWNFGHAGILAICLISGIALRRVYEWWRPRLTTPGAVIIYAAAFLRLGEGAVANGLGYAAFQALSSAALAWVLVSLIQVSEGSSQVSGAPLLTSKIGAGRSKTQSGHLR